MKGFCLRLLWAAVLVLLGLAQARSSSAGSGAGVFEKPQARPLPPHVARPRVVWRGEYGRTPSEVRAAGGFYARGLQRLMGGEALAPAEREQGASLYHHTTSLTWRYTQWVSTSSSPSVAFRYATGRAAGRPAFVYRIRADARMVDVVGTLGAHFEDAAAVAEREHAAAGYIPYAQIEGWYRVEPSEPLHRLVDPASDRVRETAEFSSNDEFDAGLYNGRSAGGGAWPRLAGFPRGSEAWKDPDYRRHEAMPVAVSFANLLFKTTCRRSESCFEKLMPQEPLMPAGLALHGVLAMESLRYGDGNGTRLASASWLDTGLR
ncbi:putative enterotoxin [Cordyceps sp. RAO-2017]|nr:putative enterotoxin [Cordyceps sp. RAO-2017]